MVMKTKVRGKAFVFGKNIDTDQIYPGRFVEYTDVEDIKKYAMYGADESFVKNFDPGDIIVAGTNFGCGSSREHAAITLKAVGAGAVLAESFGRIFFRNAFLKTIRFTLVAAKKDYVRSKKRKLHTDLRAYSARSPYDGDGLAA